MGVIQIKECPRCGKLFDCYCQSTRYGCWCSSFALTAEVLDYLKTHYQNCLCPNCIKEFSEKGVALLLRDWKKFYLCNPKPWSRGRVARQRSAKPRTAVRIRSRPPSPAFFAGHFFSSVSKYHFFSFSSVLLQQFVAGGTFTDSWRGGDYSVKTGMTSELRQKNEGQYFEIKWFISIVNIVLIKHFSSAWCGWYRIHNLQGQLHNKEFFLALSLPENCSKG